MTATEHDVEMMMAAQEGRMIVASPSVPYTKYILEDNYIPKNIPPELCAVVYDKELSLSNLTEKEINWMVMAFQRSEIQFRMGRPALSGNHKEEIHLASLLPKMKLKLARSRDGGFERKQQTTQTVIRQAVVSGPSEPKKRFRLFGRGKK